MPRGKVSLIGDTRVAKNGYHYTKVAVNQGPGNWKLTHWITAEKMLGRDLYDNEMVQFVDPKFKKDPYNPLGVRVIKKKTTSLRRRLAQVESRIAELQAEKTQIERELRSI